MGLRPLPPAVPGSRSRRSPAQGRGSPRVFLSRTGYAACVLFYIVFPSCVLYILLVWWIFLWHSGHSCHLLDIPLVYWVFLSYTGYSRGTLCTSSQCWHWEQLYLGQGRAALALGFLTFAVAGVRQFVASATLPIGVVYFFGFCFFFFCIVNSALTSLRCILAGPCCFDRVVLRDLSHQPLCCVCGMGQRGRVSVAANKENTKHQRHLSNKINGRHLQHCTSSTRT